MVPKTDSRIQIDVLHELQWDHRIRTTELGVGVDQGIVILSGFVDSYAKKIAAQEAAHRVAGVLDVANDIEVRIGAAAERTDPAIAKAVRHALEWSVFVPDDKITSTVSNGIVTLEGTVDFIAESSDAVDAVRDLQGVRAVVNRLVVRQQPVDSVRVRTSIEDALERIAEREARNIGVSVSDHTVTLTGRVHTWKEKSAVTGAVANAQGVSRVLNHLVVDPRA